MLLSCLCFGWQVEACAQACLLHFRFQIISTPNSFVIPYSIIEEIMYYFPMDITISQKPNKLKKSHFHKFYGNSYKRVTSNLAVFWIFFTVQIIVFLKESWYWGLFREFESEALYTSVGPSCGSLPIQEVLASEEKVAYNI